MSVKFKASVTTFCLFLIFPRVKIQWCSRDENRSKNLRPKPSQTNPKETFQHRHETKQAGSFDTDCSNKTSVNRREGETNRNRPIQSDWQLQKLHDYTYFLFFNYFHVKTFYREHLRARNVQVYLITIKHVNTTRSHWVSWNEPKLWNAKWIKYEKRLS